jgi:hypothetical protein
MQPRIKFGLIIGAIGLVLNVCLSTFLGLCGPFFALLAGALSGVLAARQEKLPTRGAGARAGAISGLIAGSLVFIGQVIGAVGALILVQSTGGNTIFGQMPNLTSGSPDSILVILVGIAEGACFGLIGVALSAAAGSLAAYFSTPDPDFPLNPPGY